MKYSAVAAIIGFAAFAAAAPTATTEEAPAKVALAKRTMYTVDVGLNSAGELATAYNPPFLQGLVQGDILFFQFHTGNHTVTESSIDRPCHKNPTNLIDTNFGNVITSESVLDHPFVITLSDSSTRVIYCKQKNFTPDGHCHKGMVFGINTTPEEYWQIQAKAAWDGLTA
jgi:hypothetical protein